MKATEGVRIVFTKLWGGWAGMVPLPNLILIHPDYFWKSYTLEHELVHVLQWRQYGWQFPFRYLSQWIQAGFKYHKIPFEEEAGEHMFDTWAMDWADDIREDMGV